MSPARRHFQVKGKESGAYVNESGAYVNESGTIANKSGAGLNESGTIANKSGTALCHRQHRRLGGNGKSYDHDQV